MSLLYLYVLKNVNTNTEWIDRQAEARSPLNCVPTSCCLGYRQSYASILGMTSSEPDIGLISTQLLVHKWLLNLYIVCNPGFSIFFDIEHLKCNGKKRKRLCSYGRPTSKFTLNSTTKAETTSEEWSGAQRWKENVSASCRPAASCWNRLVTTLALPSPKLLWCLLVVKVYWVRSFVRWFKNNSRQTWRPRI